MLELLLTGASGYIGGAVLDRFVKANIPNLRITAFARNKSYADKIAAIYSDYDLSVEVGEAGYDDPVFSTLVSNADIIVHTGNSSDDQLSANVIAAGIKDGALLIHTSGTYILTDESENDTLVTRKFDDEADIETITSWGLEHHHRDIDLKILGIHAVKPKVNTIVVCPPLIYGNSSGPINKVSQQIPITIRIAAQAKANRCFGEGNAIWSSVHIDDLADFYLLLLTTYLRNPSELAMNELGYYFAESGEQSWKSLVSALDAPLVKYGVIDENHTSKTEKPWSVSDLAQVLGEKSAQGLYKAFISNSGSKATRARKLGWQPKMGDVYAYLDEAVKTFVDGR
ncbi:hypothetical protein BZA70DRAFT_281264 [Myxozyma melibiosi]|uniref:NAD-dependent epimerase/dehydratase domain-containing protein n=1 Tax=Myxozyma melibiosi TaxID=54550 RepID=A0ABR1F4J2_9ASCO